MMLDPFMLTLNQLKKHFFFLNHINLILHYFLNQKV